MYGGNLSHEIDPQPIRKVSIFAPWGQNFSSIYLASLTLAGVRPRAPPLRGIHDDYIDDYEAGLEAEAELEGGESDDEECVR